MNLKKLKICLMMTLLSACSTNPPADFCLVYTKPTMKNLDTGILLLKTDRAFVNAVNANKGLYKKLCESK